MGRHADFSLTAAPGSLLEVAARAGGARIVDEDGRTYLDACGGAMVMSLGHCHPRLVEVVQRQVAELSFTYRFSFRNGPMLELAEELRSVSPLENTWCFFNSSGSESIESAIQLVRRYWQLRGRPAKMDLISRWPSFHGSTHGALSLSGSKWRAFYEPVLDKHPIAPVPNADIRRRRAPDEEAAWAVRELEDALLRRGASTIAAIVIEPVTGASGAAIAPPAGYISELRRVCDRHEVLLVFDETITAFGRTGEWFAACHWADAAPDLITFAKGVTSGIVPFSGVLVRGEVADVFERSADGFPYGHTFSGYPLGCAVAAEAIRVIRDEDLVGEARRKGGVLRERLEALAGGSPRVGDVRGLGLLQGLELVEDRETLAPAPGAAARLVAACRERGLMIYACPTPMGASTIEAVMLAPPLTITDPELDEVTAILSEALAATA
jgi:adenosylmethionine-8-amino-7-oxononanoate aminotransferase